MSDLPHALSATVKKIGETHIALETEDGQTIHWPIKLVHVDIEEGDGLDLLALTQDGKKEERRTIAKHILNELLGGSQL